MLTGFLGSGKTTILNHIINDPAMAKALVIINEFGSVGIDHDLVTASNEDTVVQMASGCLCCTIRSDLQRTLRDAPWRFARDGKRWFDRVVIETTGLADPAPIIHTLLTDDHIARLYVLDSVITTVDAATAMATLDTQQEAVKQAAIADRILLTKTDLVSEEEANAVIARLARINPAIDPIIALNGQVDASLLLAAALFDPMSKKADVQAWLNAERYVYNHDHHDHTHHDHEHGHKHGDHGHDEGHDKGHNHRPHHHHHHHDANRHDDRIRAVCLTFDTPLSAEVFEDWLELITMLTDVLRIKGIVNLAEFDRPAVIHGVQHIFHHPVMLDEWPSEDRRSRVVFITRDVNEDVLRAMLTMVTKRVKNYNLKAWDGFALDAAA